MITEKDEIACYIWKSSDDYKCIDIISNEMLAYEISTLMFPLIAYQDYSEYFENKLLRFFNKEKISLTELKTAVASTGYFEDVGVIVAHIWSKYLDDKAEYLDFYNWSVINKFSSSEGEKNKQDICPEKKNRKKTEKTQNRKAIPLRDTYFVDCGGKYAELFRDADQAYRESFSKHPTAVALFDNLPTLCPHLVKEIDSSIGKREARKLIFVGGDYLAWKSFLKVFKRYFPALSD